MGRHIKKLDQTLAEQMQFSELEIQQRKDLLNFTKEDEALLKAHKTFVANRIDQIVEQFYAKQVEVTEIALLIGDADTLRQLQNAMRRYILELFDGHYDGEYVNRRLRIGKVHKRIGVSPKLYLSAVWLLQSTLNEEIDKHVDMTGETNCGPALKEALNKLITLDTQFIFDTYISSLVSEVDAAKEEMSNYASSLEDVVAQRTQELEALSRKDSLTGLYNQRAFYEQIRHEMANATRHKDRLCLAYFDLNKFKQLNDQKGHQAGDNTLAAVGRCAINTLRTTDFPCRYGGDEFVIIMPRTNLDDAVSVCQRIITTFEQDTEHDVTISIGIVSTGPDEHMEIDSLIQAADKQMYKAKEKAHEDGASHISTP